MDIIQRDYKVSQDKMVLVHSGIRWRKMEETFLNREEVGKALCRDHCIYPKWKSLLFLGSGFANKGLDIAIHGLSAMAPDYHLMVVGKGSQAPFFRLAARLGLKKRLHFLGPQPNGWRYAAMCMALVLPSHYDPFGGAAAEGNAMGLPVLVSDKTGYADWIIQGKNGVVLKMPAHENRIQHAFKALQKLIEKPVWAPEQIREHARQVDDDVILEKLMGAFF